MTENISTKDTLCVVPWMHLNFEPDGKVVPCCLTSHHQYYAGDLNKETIEDVWNSKNMKDLRVDFLNDKKPKICATCFDRENVTNESARTWTNTEFKHVVKIIPEITEPDGTCNTMDLKYWDFRFSNLCNFKCRSCSPRYSSAWVSDYKKLGWSEQDKVWSMGTVGTSTKYDFLEHQVNTVEKIYFAGGEPLLMPEHWQILNLLVKNKRFDVKIRYNTNCSTLDYSGKSVLDYWRQWDHGKIEVWPSIDEIGERAELIRSGTVWHKVEENLKLLTTLDNIIIRPGITVGAWNVRRLPMIINHLVDIGVINAKSKYQNVFINMLEHPTHYHVHIMPDAYRQETIIELKEFITHFNKKYNTVIDWVFTHILHELTKPWDAKAAQEFIWNTIHLDELRNENTYETIPEMNLVKESVSKYNYDLA